MQDVSGLSHFRRYHLPFRFRTASLTRMCPCGEYSFRGGKTLTHFVAKSQCRWVILEKQQASDCVARNLLVVWRKAKGGSKFLRG